MIKTKRQITDIGNIMNESQYTEEETIEKISFDKK